MRQTVELYENGVLVGTEDGGEIPPERANRTTIETQATQALDTNRTFLANASPTNAQTLAQVKALTRQNNGLIRLLLNRLDGTD